VSDFVDLDSRRFLSCMVSRAP